MINLHLHTNLSDGVLSPVELLKKLESNGIETVSITDHDNVDAHIILRDIRVSDYYKGRLIPGVEMRCTYRGYSIEVLGYFIDVDNMKPYLDNKNKKVWDFQKHVYAIGKKVSGQLGLRFDDEEIELGKFAGIALFDLLNKYHDDNVKILGSEIMENRNAFYRRTLSNPGSPFFVSEEILGFSLEDTISKIHEAGGLSFLAHIGQYKMIDDKMSFLNDICANTDIDGIECYYLTHTDAETKIYLEFCKQHKLLISGGSDYHGTPLQNIICQDNIDPKDLSWLSSCK